MASTDIIVPVAKAKGGFITVTKEDIDAMPGVSYQEVLMQGFKAVFGRGQTKITADTYPDEEERKAAAMAIAEKNWEACKKGEIRITGGKAKKTGQGAYMTEARRLARQAVKDAIKADGGKISHYEASEITKAANALIEEYPSYLEQATKNVDERKAKPVASGIMSLISISDKKVKAAEAKKAKSGQLSAKQAGLTAKPRPPVHA
jgi:ribosomal protein S24E